MIETSRITIAETSIVGLLGVSGFHLGTLAQQAIPALVVYTSSTLLQVDQFSTDLCNAGVGTLITIGLFLLAAVLFVKAIPDIYKGFDKRGSASSGSQRQSGGHFNDAGLKLVGVIVVATLPTLLASAGFSLLSCVNAVQVFG